MAQQSSSSSSYSSYLYNLGASALKYGYNTVARFVLPSAPMMYVSLSLVSWGDDPIICC